MSVPGTVYLICLSRPYKTEKRRVMHYLGWTGNGVENRLEEHRTGKGSRFLRAAALAGISFKVVRTWENVDRNFERKLKRNGHLGQHCPKCRRRVLKMRAKTARQYRRAKQEAA